MNGQIKNTGAFPPMRVEQSQIEPLLLSVVVLLTGLWSSQLYAVPVTAPIVGEIEKITLNDSNDHWSGGVIVAGGQNIILPKNILIDLPANRVTLQQLFTEASASCKTQNETGLAKGDACNASGTGGIATIQATRLVNGNVIAGDVFIQKGAESVSGQITYIDYTQGFFRVNGVVGDATTGVMVRLNDPDSRHTIQSGLGCIANSPNCSPDPRFTLDGDNYTNVFSTGYPLCIPSTKSRSFTDTLGLGVTSSQANSNGVGDVLCPATNRPGQPVADSRRFAPILIGDTITAEGNYEMIGGVRFLSAHSTMVGTALSTSNAPGQPDYLFLDEVEIDAPGFQNQRARTLIIGFATLAPADVLFWSIHYDPKTNSPHEFPLATTVGCDTAGGVGTCTAQGLVGAGANIFKIRHDVDFLVGAKPKVNPCSHLQADFRFAALNPCANGGTIAEQFAILSPIPHEIQARTGRKVAHMQANTPLITIDINGNEATNGQYLFPFGIGLGGISVPEMVEIDLNALGTPVSFTGIPWNLDRRLSPGGCLDANNDGIGECETTPQPLDPFPFEGDLMDPRNLVVNIPTTPYNDPNYTDSAISNVSNRILSYVNPDAVRSLGNAAGLNDTGNFTPAILDWHAAPPTIGGPGSGQVTEPPMLPQALICSANSAFNTPPTVVNDVITTNVNLGVVVPVLSNDSDVNGDPLTVTGISTPTHGAAILNADGTVSYTPAANFTGNDSFTYTVSDGTASVTGTVSVTVNPLLITHPTAVDDTAITDEDISVNIPVLLNDKLDNSQTGSGALSVATVTSSNNGGSVTISADKLSVSYTPKTNFNGTDVFTYSIADGRGGSSTATVTVTVNPVNDVPVAVNDVADVTSGSTIDIPVLTNDMDIDGDILTISSVSQPLQSTLGTVTANGTSVRFVAKPNVSGVTTFTYTINDGHGGNATATVTVRVNALVIDVIAFSAQPEYRISKSELRAAGTGNINGKTITLRLGTSPSGTIVGTAPVTLGVWTIRVTGISIAGNSQVTAWSNGGGKATQTLLIRN